MKISSESQALALVLLRAVAIRNGSYDTVMASKAGAGADHAAFYGVSIPTACERAATYLKAPALGQPALMLLTTNCVDAITWANAVTDPLATCEPTMHLCQHGEDYGCPLCKANYARVGVIK